MYFIVFIALMMVTMLLGYLAPAVPQRFRRIVLGSQVGIIASGAAVPGAPLWLRLGALVVAAIAVLIHREELVT